MRFAVMVLAAAVMAASPAMAQTDPTAPPATTETTEQGADNTAATGETAEQNSDQEQICRTVQRTESRLRSRRERICATRAQWETMQEQNARDLRNVGSVQNSGNN